MLLPIQRQDYLDDDTKYDESERHDKTRSICRTPLARKFRNTLKWLEVMAKITLVLRPGYWQKQRGFVESKDVGGIERMFPAQV